ncbi:anti-phage ZorAB system protein ZorA [Robbsia andropogonis]|uniref:anti-phage ZorAB system protein ZorA n=1 Tax=Robbsia andropogonis TaxID=28092 RepID=UPI00209FCFC4|nr:anti-phage ZorAB system protein ZorA [Robbsia andropogonis]MCP1118907.1 anti-phage defense ZorAB system protein ZorA [Robbsia andropogonis]MCP1128741.1 anti-phage defense ZorAB system protein ZorA [Robbsia andropogonis]
MNIQSLFNSVPAPALVTAAFLAVLLIAVVAFFVGPSIRHLFRLRGIQIRIERFTDGNYPSQFKAVFADDVQLAHLWSEYGESLHVQREERDGQMIVRAVRATVPAELYFNSQIVIDSRLRTEFFKHVPGIFTGIGIIGTFSGLIEGLRAFQVSENAATVRGSLEALMHTVGEAFLVSASAIGAAMLTTFFEKLILASLYRRTEEIAHKIDACFEAGAGEEYLARLVKASEESASQSKILKDALVKEMGELLRELTSAQIEASKEQYSMAAEAGRQNNAALGQVIAESIQHGLKGPLEEIAATVKSASGDQSVSAGRMLQDVMMSFSQRLNDLFGGQISGLSELNKQTAESIQQAVNTLHTLVASIEASSQRSTDAMAQRMAEAIEKMESRQEAINAQTAAFVEQLRKLVEASQSETNQKLQTTLETLGTNVGEMLSALSGAQKEVFENNRVRELAMSERATGAVAAMSGSVDAVVKELSDATAQMAQSVTAITHATSSSIERMNAGAEKLGNASRDFAEAGKHVTGIISQTADISSKLTTTAGSLASGAGAIQELLGDYRSHRDSIGQLVTELRATVDSARKEAALTGDILNRIETSTSHLGAAQKQADEYLAGVSTVLAEAHGVFATEVKRTLDKANGEFHTKLTSAVGLLSSAVSELEVTLVSMGSLTPARS